jgi:predicted ATPase
MPITKISIENFKHIRDRVEIPIRPITLLFGANRSGKSTILYALLYLRGCLKNHRSRIFICTRQCGQIQNLTQSANAARLTNARKVSANLS